MTLTDGNGCTEIGDVSIVSENSGPVLTTTQENVSCNGANDGSIDLIPTGGATPYSYEWNDGLTLEDRAGLTPGNYTVVVTDGNGCIAVTTVTISEPASMSVTFNATPSTGNDGTATAIVAGGAAPYTYQWNNGQTTQQATGLAVGTYSVFVTDTNGCTIQADVAIEMSTSIYEHEGLVGFNLSPNPSTGVFAIDIEFAQRQEGFLHIYNVLGQEIERLPFDGITEQIPMDMSNHAAGTYIAVLRTQLGETAKRFVITR